jgi:hypothetical protein
MILATLEWGELINDEDQLELLGTHHLPLDVRWVVDVEERRLLKLLCTVVA